MSNHFLHILQTILPFLIIIALWVVIINRAKKATKINKTTSQESLDLLREIRDELKELNKNNSQKQ